MEHFVCGIEMVKLFVNTHLHYIASNLKSTSKMLTFPPWKNSADAHVACLIPEISEKKDRTCTNIVQGNKAQSKDERSIVFTIVL